VSPPWGLHLVKQIESTHAGYLDRKWALQGMKASGKLELKIVSTVAAPIVVCETACNVRSGYTTNEGTFLLINATKTLLTAPTNHPPDTSGANARNYAAA